MLERSQALSQLPKRCLSLQWQICCIYQSAAQLKIIYSNPPFPLLTSYNMYNTTECHTISCMACGFSTRICDLPLMATPLVEAALLRSLPCFKAHEWCKKTKPEKCMPTLAWHTFYWFLSFDSDNLPRGVA